MTHVDTHDTANDSRTGGKNELAPTGAELIAAERQRQIDAEGWTPDHDDDHEAGELLSAAVNYMDAGCEFDLGLSLPPWPWEQSAWKPSDDLIRNLVKAGALIAAEIDRQQRAAICPNCGQPLTGSFPTCSSCQLVEALKRGE